MSYKNLALPKALASLAMAALLASCDDGSSATSSSAHAGSAPVISSVSYSPTRAYPEPGPNYPYAYVSGSIDLYDADGDASRLIVRFALEDPNVIEIPANPSESRVLPFVVAVPLGGYPGRQALRFSVVDSNGNISNEIEQDFYVGIWIDSGIGFYSKTESGFEITSTGPEACTPLELGRYDYQLELSVCPSATSFVGLTETGRSTSWSERASSGGLCGIELQIPTVDLERSWYLLDDDYGHYTIWFGSDGRIHFEGGAYCQMP